MALVNKAQLADLLGYAERSLTEWQEEGMPIARRADMRGQANEYDSASVVSWLLERAIRKAKAENPKDELYRSQTRLNQLKLAEMERTLVDAAEVEAEYARMILNARQQLLQLADRLAPELDAAAGEERKRELLGAAILEALKSLSQYEAMGSGDDAGELERQR